MKRLTLLRHAKSSWEDPDLCDFDRPLNKRGKADAPKMGQRLAAKGLKPDAIVSSPAKRARKTAKAVAKELALSKDRLVFKEQIYEAEIEALLEVVRGLDERWGHIILVGHNPGFTELGNWLSGEMVENIPTCGVFDMELAVDTWSQTKKESGRLIEFDYPKKTLPQSSQRAPRKPF